MSVELLRPGDKRKPKAIIDHRKSARSELDALAIDA
jgi:hypothetical protein